MVAKSLYSSNEYIFISITMEVVNMPGMDRTGPEGKGPMTGRKMGKCEGASPQQQGFGRGFGMGRGRGRRFMQETEN